MSIQPFPSQDQGKPIQRTRAWIALSFIGSMALICWAFTIPARRAELARRSSLEAIAKSTPIQLSDNALILTGSPEEIRDSAMAADEEFLRAIKMRRASGQHPAPGIEETRIKWQQKAERVKREIENFADAPEGSIGWVYRKEQLESLQDGPQ